MIKNQSNAACRFLPLAIALVAGATGCSDRGGAETDLEISSVYISEPVMGERAAMYFTVANHGPVADHLIAVSTPIAELAEIHRTVADGGMMRMEPVESLVVPPGDGLHLAPGGYHVMLLELKEPIGPGDTVDVTLSFRYAGAVPVQARVISLPKLEGVLDPARGDHH
ncbi:MAG: copper chaperone PCu(A)C [Gemmatimonadales bacterium]|jgi:copper(I)-binding protein